MPRIDMHDPQGFSDRQAQPGDQQMELIIIRGRTRQRVRPVVGRVFLIGAAEDCDLVLVDDQFAPVNGYLIRSADQIQLRWLTAEPELTINGQPREHATLLDQDRIRTASYEFLVRVYSREPGGGEITRTVPAPHAWHLPAEQPAGAPRAELAPATVSVPAPNGPNANTARVAMARLRLFDAPAEGDREGCCGRGCGPCHDDPEDD